MLNFLRRVKASAQDIFGPMTTPVDAARAPVQSVPSAESVGGRPVGARLVITISQPQPISEPLVSQPRIVTEQAPAVAMVTPVITNAMGGAAPKRTVLRSTRPRPSPVAAARKLGKPVSAKPRRSAAVRAVVAVRQASAQSVRMQAALMKCQRRRDAERALAKLTALLPSATIHTLRKAA